MTRRILPRFFIIFLVLFTVSATPQAVLAGCCSFHGGVCGCQCCDHTPFSQKCKDLYSVQCSVGDTTAVQLDKKAAALDLKKLDESKTFKKAETFLVKRVIDGDTLVLDNGEKIRLIGVDTPETVHPKKAVQYFGREASLFTKNLVEKNKVRLEYDYNKRDKYNRLLAYVYLEDGTFVNAEIVKQGYGFAYTRFPFKYLEDFRMYERQARENKRGLWK